MEPSPDTLAKDAPNPRPPGPRWMKVLLFLSLAANLAIIGVGIGAVLHGRAEGRPGGGMRDPSFGAFDQALSRSDRAALRREFIRQAGPLMQNRAATRSNLMDLLASLRAQPFDAETLESALAKLNESGLDRMKLGQKLLSDRLLTMTAEDRARFADRLEEVLSRRMQDKREPEPAD